MKTGVLELDSQFVWRKGIQAVCRKTMNQLLLFLFVFISHFLTAADLPLPSGFNPQPAQDTPEARKFAALVRGLLVDQAKYDAEWFRKNIKEAGLPPEIRKGLLDPLSFYYQSTMNQKAVYDLIIEWHKELRPEVPLQIEKPWTMGAPMLPGANPSPALPVASIVKNDLRLREYQVVKPPAGDLREFGGISIKDAKVSGDTLWLDTRAFAFLPDEPATNCAVLCGINLKTKQQQSLVYAPAIRGAGSFETMGNQLVFRQADGLQRYDLVTRQKNPLPHVLEADARLVSSGTNLYAISSNSLVNVNLETGTTTVLASLRRRPAVTVLDDLPTLMPGLLLPRPDGALTLLADRSVYNYTPGKQWSRAYTLTTNGVMTMASVGGGSNGNDAIFAKVDESFEFTRLFGVMLGADAPRLLVGNGRSQWSWQKDGPVLNPEWVYENGTWNGSQAWCGDDFLASFLSSEILNGSDAASGLAYFQTQPRRIVILKCLYPTTGEFDRSRRPDIKLVSVAGGWAMVNLQGSGFWFFTNEELIQALAGAK